MGELSSTSDILPVFGGSNLTVSLQRDTTTVTTSCTVAKNPPRKGKSHLKSLLKSLLKNQMREGKIQMKMVMLMSLTTSQTLPGTTSNHQKVITSRYRDTGHQRRRTAASINSMTHEKGDEY